MRAPRRLIGFIAVIQTVLFLAHYFLYETWTFAAPPHAGGAWVEISLAVLSISFMAASLLAFRFTNGPVRMFYRAAAVWMGLLCFRFIGAIFAWIIFGVALLAGL